MVASSLTVQMYTSTPWSRRGGMAPGWMAEARGLYACAPSRRTRATGSGSAWETSAPVAMVGSAALTRSRFRETEGLTGNTVPQVPAWQLAGGVRWLAPTGTTLQALVRAVADQYEDDRNTLTLGAATLVDLSASHTLDRRLSLFAAVENLFDVEYDTGRTPLRTIGIPRSAYAGVRVHLR